MFAEKITLGLFMLVLAFVLQFLRKPASKWLWPVLVLIGACEVLLWQLLHRWPGNSSDFADLLMTMIIAAVFGIFLGGIIRSGCRGLQEPPRR